MGRPHLQSYVNFWLRGHVTNSKNVYLLFQNTYGHQTCQNSNSKLEEPTFKVMWCFDYVVTWKTQQNYICSSRIPIATKLARNSDLPFEEPTFKVMWLFYYVVTNVNTHTCSSAIPMATKLGRVVFCCGGTPSSSSRDLLIAWLCEKVERSFVCSFRIFMAIKLGRVVTYH